MKVLLDRCLPKRFTAEFSAAHLAVHASDLPWGAESNGALVRSASEEGFEVLLTVDKGMQFQTSLSGLSLGALVLDVSDNTLETLQLASSDIREALQRVKAGEYLVLRTGPWK